MTQNTASAKLLRTNQHERLIDLDSSQPTNTSNIFTLTKPTNYIELDAKLGASVDRTIELTTEKIVQLNKLKIKAIFMFTGPQSTGKTSSITSLQHLGKSVSADNYMPIPFNPHLLENSHQQCQLLCLKYSLEGFHVFVDNTNMKRIDCSIYKFIAIATGAIIVPIIFGAELWFNTNLKNRQSIIDVLDFRCRIRETTTGKCIPKDIIERTIQSSLLDFKMIMGKDVNIQTTNEDITTWLTSYHKLKLPLNWEDSETMGQQTLTDSCTQKPPNRDIQIERVKFMIMKGLELFHATQFNH